MSRCGDDLEKVKGLIRRFGGEYLHRIIYKLLMISGLNNKTILFSGKMARTNKVNLNYWDGASNLGDIISPVIVDYVARCKGICMNKTVSRTKHLYAVGSVITAGCQDCTIWGSGILNYRILYRLKGRKLDVRAVRGPITQMILQEFGYDAPTVFGDPAILMPRIYDPAVEKKYKVSVITHMNETLRLDVDCHRISILTEDYHAFVEEIKASELVVSSSLHGIIFAESYGVPAIMLKPKTDILKYYDYYYGTGRYQFPVVESVEEAFSVMAPPIPDFSIMQEKLIEAFPVDLWE